MHVELRGHLRDGQPTCGGQVLQVAVDVVRPAQGADACGGKGQTASGPQPPPVERLGNLSIGLFGGEHADLFDKRGRSTTQVRRRERQWTLDLTRRAAAPADGDLDYVWYVDRRRENRPVRRAVVLPHPEAAQRRENPNHRRVGHDGRALDDDAGRRQSVQSLKQHRPRHPAITHQSKPAAFTSRKISIILRWFRRCSFKALHVLCSRAFAARIDHHASVSLALKVTPRLLGRVDDASKREGVGRTEWIRRYQRGEEPAGASISRHVFLLWLLKRFAGSAEGRYADLHRAAYDFNDLQVRDRFGEALGDQRGERRDGNYR